MSLSEIDAFTSHSQVKRLYSKYAVNERLQDVAEVQKFVRSVSSGSFTLSYGGETSSSIAYDADQYGFEAGLKSIFGLRQSRVLSTSGSTPNFTNIVALVDVTGDADAITVGAGALTGTVTVTTLQTGNAEALDDAIIMACMEILKYVEKWYSVEQLLRSNLVNQWATWLSCYYLSGREGNDPPKVFAREFDRIVKQLEKVMIGAMNIPEILKRRSGAIAWRNLRADPRFSFRVLRVEKGTSSKAPRSTIPQVVDYQEMFTPEI